MLKIMFVSISLSLIGLSAPNSFAENCQGEVLFNGVCRCKDNHSPATKTFACHPDYYGQRHGKSQAGLCQEACERFSGFAVELAPPEKKAEDCSGKTPFNGVCRCKDRHSSATQTFACHPDYYGKRHGSSQAGLCKEACERFSNFEVIKAPAEEVAKNCDDPNKVPFNGVCRCKDKHSGESKVFSCHPEFYGQRHGMSQAGLCKEACERFSGFAVDMPPPERHRPNSNTYDPSATPVSR